MTNANGNGRQTAIAELHVHEVVRSAQRELQDLLKQRSALVQRIGTLKQTLFGLAAVFGDSVLNPELLDLLDRKAGNRQPGFTQACRLVLMQASLPLTASGVCDELRRRSPGLLQNHKDPVASVTTVLNRLVQYGEARSSWNNAQKRVWEWASSTLEPAAGGNTQSFDSLRETSMSRTAAGSE